MTSCLTSCTLPVDIVDAGEIQNPFVATYSGESVSLQRLEDASFDSRFLCTFDPVYQMETEDLRPILSAFVRAAHPEAPADNGSVKLLCRLEQKYLVLSQTIAVSVIRKALKPFRKEKPRTAAAEFEPGCKRVEITNTFIQEIVKVFLGHHGL